LAWLDAHLQRQLYTTAQAVAAVGEAQFEVRYTESGMTALLHRLGFVYRKPTRMPGKADPDAQRAFLDTDATIKDTKDPNDPIDFVDAVHPQHNRLRLDQAR
jgi:transposase